MAPAGFSPDGTHYGLLWPGAHEDDDTGDRGNQRLERVNLQHLELGFGSFRADTPDATALPLPDLEGVIVLPTGRRHGLVDRF